MYRLILAMITALLLSTSFVANASYEAELQGYGVFSNLNKDWMLMALYSDVADDTKQTKPQRLEIKIATKKFSTRRFRQLWLEALAVEHGTDKIAAMQEELQTFFNVVQGTLRKGDAIILERTDVDGLAITDVKINYHSLAQLSEGFLDVLVQSLVGKHPPTQALKTGLTGHASLREQTNVSIRFERLEPTLPRIAEISRWGKRILASNR